MVRKIWIDTDLAVGMKREVRREGYSDVDDGYAILQLMKSKVVDIVGMSSVFGNTSRDNAQSLCEFMVASFYQDIPVCQGAATAMDVDDIKTNTAVEGIRNALGKEPLTILAIGPATNVGLLCALYPEVVSQIQEVILVAGRRTPQDAFTIGNKGLLAMDLNFDLDNFAFQLLLQSGIKITLCPYEISSKVWLEKSHLDRLESLDKSTEWLAGHSRPWLNQWLDQDAHGFNPFDVLASHYILYPNDIISEPLNARLELHADDIKNEADNTSFKNYLICDRRHGYPVNYCYDIAGGFMEKLMKTFQ